MAHCLFLGAPASPSNESSSSKRFQSVRNLLTCNSTPHARASAGPAPFRCLYFVYSRQAEMELNHFLFMPFVWSLHSPCHSMLLLQVLAFGGGLIATLQGGHISDTEAMLGITVLAGSTLKILGTKFTYNRAQRGGAVYGSWSSRLMIDGAIFQGNTAANHDRVVMGRHESSSREPLDGNGGALYMMRSTAIVHNSTMQTNRALRTGGAMYVGGGSQLHMESTVLFKNIALTGGGIAIYDKSQVLLNSCELANNKARTIARAPNSGGDLQDHNNGGGVFVQDSNVTAVNTTLFGNEAEKDGGKRYEYLQMLW